MGVRKRNKYHNRRVLRAGIWFASIKEADRYFELSMLQRAGVISDLRTQVSFELIPAQYVGGRCAERAVKYVADFVYIADGEMVVEDTKGVRTAEYIIKRKLMLYVHRIRILEV